MLLAVAAVVLAVGRSRSAGTFTSDQVESAFNRQGLSIRKVSVPGAVFGGSYLSPDDGAFTVLVLGSIAEAERSFAPWETNAGPDTFELREGNVIVIADASNSDKPLPPTIRARIRAAVRPLRES